MAIGGIEAIAPVLPDLVPVKTLVEAASLPQQSLQTLHRGGLLSVPVGDGRPVTRWLHAAACNLAEQVADFTARTRAVLYAHSIPIYGPMEEPFLAQCIAGLGLDAVPRVAVGGQPCAVLHLAIRLALGKLTGHSPDAGILVLGGDVAYRPEDRLFFGSSMGDSAVALYVTRRAATHEILSQVHKTFVYAWQGELSSEDDIGRFRRANPSHIRAAIEECLRRGDVELAALRYIVPHTPYLQIWDTMAGLLRFPRDRILTDYLPATGHLNSNDSFIHYARAVAERRLEPRDLALLVNPGFGGSRGCTLVRFLGSAEAAISEPDE